MGRNKTVANNGRRSHGRRRHGCKVGVRGPVMMSSNAAKVELRLRVLILSVNLLATGTVKTYCSATSIRTDETYWTFYCAGRARISLTGATLATARFPMSLAIFLALVLLVPLGQP